MIKLVDILLENEEKGDLRQAIQTRKAVEGTSPEVKKVLDDFDFMLITNYNIPLLNILIKDLTQTVTDEEFEQVLRAFEKRGNFAKGKINRMTIGKFIGIVTNRQK